MVNRYIQLFSKQSSITNTFYSQKGTNQLQSCFINSITNSILRNFNQKNMFQHIKKATERQKRQSVAILQ